MARLNKLRCRTKLVHLPILEGQTIIILPKWETESGLRAMQQYKVTMVLLVPPLALALVSGNSAMLIFYYGHSSLIRCLKLNVDPLVDKYDLSALKYLLSGAAPLGPELQERLRKRLNCYVTQAYGMTESSPTSHYAPYEQSRPGSCGLLLPNVQGRVVDPVTLKDVPNFEDEGELWLKVAQRQSSECLGRG